MNIKKYCLAFCFVSACLFANAETLKKETDSVLASVNGVPVSLSDVLYETQSEEYYMAGALDQKSAQKAIYELRKKTLDDLIDRKLILAEYEKNPFPIDNQRISNVLDDMAVRANCRTRSEFFQKLRAAGLSVEEFRRKVEERVTVQYVVGRELYIYVNVSPKQIYEYYKQHEEEFSTPEQIQLNVLYLNSSNPDFEMRKKLVADRLAANPSDFYTLVKEYSELPGAKKNSSVLLTPVDKLREEFKAASDKKKFNQIIGPLEIPEEGVYYLLTDKFIPPVKKSLNEVRGQIIAELEKQQREKAYKDYVKKLRSEAIIRYMY